MNIFYISNFLWDFFFFFFILLWWNFDKWADFLIKTFSVEVKINCTLWIRLFWKFKEPGFHQILWLKLFVDVYGIFDFFLCTIVFCCFFFPLFVTCFSSLLMCIFVVCSERPFCTCSFTTFFFMICKASQRTWIYLILFTGMT